MSTPKPVVIDFETEAIDARPVYPPKPVGFSIKNPGDKKSTYWSWGHPTENNCTFEKAQRVLKGAWRGSDPLLFQNGKFDVDVAETHMDVPKISWDKIHDTLFLLFLHDPHARSLSLKPSAERILGMKPKERDAVKEWILAHVPEAKRKPKEWGAHIAKAPGGLVGIYADGDVIRTERIFNKLYRDIHQRDMMTAYDRERHLMPIMMRNEREGIKINVRALMQDLKIQQDSLTKCDNWLRKRLKCPDLNVDSDRQLADALEASGVVTEWVYTAKGNRSTSKKNMTLDMYKDKRVQAVLGHRNILSTCIGTFMIPWLEMAHATGGTIHTSWNQVRQTHGNEKNAGARTGRFSSSPNFQNVPKNWKKAIADGYVFPAFLGIPPLPLMRTYFLPDSKDHLWGRRDYNQQELRLLAHFEDGDLMRKYCEDPRLDIHALVQTGFLDIADIEMERDPVKIMNFGEIYGMGLGEMAQRMRIDIATAKLLKISKEKLLPDLKALNDGIKQRGKAGLAIRTWGGREYYCEPAMYVKKFDRVMSFEYKLLNYLIQGSASDVTKESIIRYDEHPKKEGRLTVTVHDENDISAHKKVMKQEMLLLRDVMQSVEVDVPMLSDGEVGKTWGNLTALKEN